MTEIWIVEGSTGEYSDHDEWPVKAFRDKARAERLVVEAQARANEIFAISQNGIASRWDVLKTHKNEFDPDMRLDYTGTHYTCYPIELVED